MLWLKLLPRSHYHNRHHHPHSARNHIRCERNESKTRVKISVSLCCGREVLAKKKKKSVDSEHATFLIDWEVTVCDVSVNMFAN